MKMFKTLATAVALCAAVVVQARPLEEIQKSGTIILGSEGQYAPFNFFKGKQLTGYEIEVAEAVVKKMGLKYEWKTVGFDALLTGLAQDRWDLVIASHAITDERSKAVTFTLPHYCSGGIIVSMKPEVAKAAVRPYPVLPPSNTDWRTNSMASLKALLRIRMTSCSVANLMKACTWAKV